MINVSLFRKQAASQPARDGGSPGLCSPQSERVREGTPHGKPRNPDEAIGRRFLFVGASAGWFDRVEGDLRDLEPGWQVQSAPDSARALTALKSLPFDALIVDAGVAESRGLIETVERDFPRTLRLVACDATVQSDLKDLNRPGVKLIAQNGDTRDLADALNTHLQVQDWMSDPFITKLLARIQTLPTLPSLHTKVTAELQSPNGSLEIVSEHVRRDPVMAAKFLQAANSAFQARACPVTDPAEAVMFLGAEQTRSLILMAGVFSQFDSVHCPGFSPDQIWSHSLQIGSLARGIALVETENPKMAEMAYTAGLLHDLGKLILAANVPGMCATVLQLQKNKDLPPHEAEVAVFGTTHGELAACLLGSWGLPFHILEAVAWHHRPQLSKRKGFSVLTAVHVANVLARETGHGSGGSGNPYCLDAVYLKRVGVDQQLQTWREACGIVPNR